MGDTTKLTTYMKRLLSLVAVIFFTNLALGQTEKAALKSKTFPEFVDSFISHQEKKRRFILHLPKSYGGKEVPLIIFLHGAGGNSEVSQSFTNFNQVSNDNGFIVAYPQGFFEKSPNSFVWAAARGLPADSAGIDDVGFIDKLVTNLKGQYKINAKKIYLCGFSNGGFLTQRIAFEKNQQFAAFGSLGATMSQNKYGSGDPGRAIPMMFVLGSSDPLVPYNGGIAGASTTLPIVGIEKAVSFWVTNNNCQTTIPSIDLPNKSMDDNSTVTLYEYTNGNCNSKVIFYKINGGGHTWPGVKLTKQSPRGETNLDISAGQELWVFFKQFELCK